MLSKNSKRLILISIAIIVSSIIWNINASWGNSFITCLILSTTTFLLIFTPFEIYWSFRDIWFERWNPISTAYAIKTKVSIEVDGGHIQADLIKPIDRASMEKMNTIIIVAHGFSDTKETVQYYCFPLVYQGYVVLAYDARGIGESKKTGKRSEFIKRIDDYDKIFQWIKNDEYMQKMKIYSAGFSIGAMTALCGGFAKKDVEKIIAISAMSKFRQNLPKYNILVMFSYFIKGVNLSPSDAENNKISPYFVFKQLKETISSEEWKKFSEKVMLIHCRNDKVIKLKNFEENRSILGIPDSNLLILRKGGHSQKKNELAIVGASLRFFNSSLI